MRRSDAQLVHACRKGDPAAWEALVRRYQRLIWAIPRRAGLSEDAAAEVFQSTFAALVEHVGGIEQPERLKAWLVTTARRETWHAGRRLARVRATTAGSADDDPVLEVADGRALPDEVVLRLEEQHTVRTALAALDERCRTLLTLLFYAEEPPSYAAIAAALGTREGSIGPTRARCLEKLRRLVDLAGS
jgi:RNA polymerase sigma factor (sigma-70 family)